MLEWDQWLFDGGPCPYPDVAMIFSICLFCVYFFGYRVGINLGVHNKAKGNLEIKYTLFQFSVQGHFGLVAKWFDFLHLGWHSPNTYPAFPISLKKHEYFILIFRDNYSKPTCGLGENHFAYPWFEKCHLTHLRYVPFVFRNPPLLKSGINKYFCSNFISLSSQNKK